MTTSWHTESLPHRQPGRDSATLGRSNFSYCLQLTSIHHGIFHHAAAVSPFFLWLSIPNSFLPPFLPHLLSITDCNVFTIIRLKALWLDKCALNFIQHYYLLPYDSLVAHILRLKVMSLQCLWCLMDIY